MATPALSDGVMYVRSAKQPVRDRAETGGEGLGRVVSFLSMNSLADPGAIESLVTRLNKLHPERPRAWGRMTPNEMLCHLGDAFDAAPGRAPLRAGRHLDPAHT